MTDTACDCSERPSDSPAAPASTPPGWIAEHSVLETALPPDLQAALGRFVGHDTVETLAKWADIVREHTGGGSIAIDDLCHRVEPTEHWGTVDDDRWYFVCFYDAVILAALIDEPVDIRTLSPIGEVIEATAVGSDDLVLSPKSAVFSFGIEPTGRAGANTPPTLEEGYAAICPYVQAFPDKQSYEQWAVSVPAITVGMPLEGATDLARRLAK